MLVFELQEQEFQNKFGGDSWDVLKNIDFETLNLKNDNEKLKYRPYIHTFSSQESRHLKEV